MSCRSTPTVQLLRVRAGAVTLSSMCLLGSMPNCGLTLCLHSWIQGHPEFGFGFKALVCHDGVRQTEQSRLVLLLIRIFQVFSAMYSGYATDELFFVRRPPGT